MPVTQPFFTRGDHTLQVSNQIHKINRDRLVKKLKENENLAKRSVIVLKGGTSLNRWDTDCDPIFRQESNFWWAFGVEEENCYGSIDVLTSAASLYIPRLPEDYAIWSGKIMPKEHFQTRYGVDNVFYTDEISTILTDLAPESVLILGGENSDSKRPVHAADFEGIGNFTTESETLYNTICELRVFKTKGEQEIMKYSNEITSDAHCKVMQRVRVGMMEYQIEAMFLFNGYYYGGARKVAYCNICTSGENAAVLHYGHAGAPNDRKIADGDICLIDMGLEYYCYASDVTCSYPANGKFSKEQKIIYEAVLKARNEVLQSIKPGVSWVEMHLLADSIHLDALKKAKLLKGDVKDMMRCRLGAVFMPHGLGHLMGLDVHDVGGYLPGTPERPKEEGVKNLRTARKLQPGMVLTVEPGIYFIDTLIDKALADKEQKEYFNDAVFDKFRDAFAGGVRLEDGFIVTEEGMELMTDVPRTVKEVLGHLGKGKKIKVDLPQGVPKKEKKKKKGWEDEEPTTPSAMPSLTAIPIKTMSKKGSKKSKRRFKAIKSKVSKDKKSKKGSKKSRRSKK